MESFKKMFFLSLLIVFCVSLPHAAFALSGFDDGVREITPYVSENLTSNTIKTTVSTSTIDENYRVIGVTVCPNNSAAIARANFVALYDGASNSASSAPFDEIEARTGESLTSFYPGAKKISTSLIINQGPFTTVTVYCERYR